ncbi:MAG: glycosyl hydrolase 53 family protein [Prevotella sp.]|jgi:arabinogalactan endo-1,4-beta-galactosidase
MSSTVKTILTAALLFFTSAASHADQVYVGGDISLLTKYEEHGAIYYDHNGNKIYSLLPFFKEQGWNAMRVRLFVDPSNASDTDKEQGVCQDLDYVVKLCKRIKQAGFALMLDFHYSDSWADPSNQWTPQAWQELTDDSLAQQIYDYTASSLQTLIDSGATPDMIQTGNEISYGMCWGSSESDAKKCYPSSSSENWDRFMKLLKQATQACRDKCPNAKIILHSERVSNLSSLQSDNTNYAALNYWLDKITDANINYDIVGLSYYPYYHGPLNCIEGAITTIEEKVPTKKIMVVETGYSLNYAVSTNYDYTSTYPITDEGQNNFTTDLIEKLANHSSVTGLFWWWPEANEYGLDWNTNRVTDKWYNASLFDNETGKATSALSTLQTFIKKSTGISQTTTESLSKSTDNQWFTVNGMRVDQPDKKGIYIHGGQKILY